MKKFLNIVFLILLTLVISGCEDDEQTIKETDNENDIVVESKDGSISFSGEDEDGSFHYEDNGEGDVSITFESEEGSDISLNTKGEIPEDFPDEIPFTEQYEIDRVMTVDEAIMIFYIPMETSLDDIVSLYKDFAAANGFEITTDFDSGDMYALHLKKGNELVVLFINHSEGEPSSVQLSHAVE